ncbi:MAG: DNA repair exonuclease [Oscillospiraceae bacterium]|nr:DNA repair exonuclease [Oscillospiraceae bacterium]
MSDKIKILHCSDLHLCAELSFLKSKAKNRKLEVLNTLQRIVNLCSTNMTDLLIIAGDLFDSNHADINIVSAVKKMFAAVPALTVAIVAGNHDYYAVDSPYSDEDWSRNVIIFFSSYSMIEIPEKNLRLYGSSFISSYQNKNNNSFSVPDDDMINILIYHGDIVTDNQTSMYNPITVKQLSSSGFDYVALGHIHKASEIQKAGNTYYAYSGTPDGNGFDETGKKGVYIGEVSKGNVKLNFINTSSRIFADVSFDITSLTSNNQIKNAIIKKLEHLYPENFAENLYKITLTGKYPEGFLPDSKSIALDLSDSLYYVTVENNSRPDINISALASDFSLKGIFVQKMLKKMQLCTNESDKATYENALYLGLKAFDGEVGFNED